MMTLHPQLVATPLPTSPTRGEVPAGAWGRAVPHTRFTPPPSVGEVGRGAPLALNEPSRTHSSRRIH
jgi:hypothetical protein